MYIEEKLLQENLFSKEHINELYNLFVVLSENQKFIITPFNLISIFQNISFKKQMEIDQDVWNQIFFQIDHDKDGGISFQDFIRFICLHLKLIFGEIGDRMSFNKVV